MQAKFNLINREQIEKVGVAVFAVLILLTFARVALAFLVPDAFGAEHTIDFDSKMTLGAGTAGAAVLLTYVRTWF